MSEHYSDEQMARYASGSATHDRLRIEKHLAECGQCRSLLEEIRSIEEALNDPDTWLFCNLDDSDSDDRGEHLQAVISQAVAEDEEASVLLAGIIDRPAAVSYEDLPRKAKYHTAGIARYLSRAARKLVERDPPDALILANNAIAVAEALDHQRYPSSMRFALIGSAWKERANALRMMGDYTAAESAFDSAERAFRKTPYAESELARIQFGRATVLEKSEKLDRAMELALESAAAFEALGDRRRRIHSMIIVGGVRQKRSMYAEARKTFLDLIPEAEALRDEVLVGGLRSNAAWSAAEMGLLREAADDFNAALPIFLDRGISTQVVAIRWGLGHLLLIEGKLRETIEALRPVLEEAVRLEVHVMAAMIVLDIAEALLALRRRSDVPPLCRYAISVFRKAGREDSLLTALAYLKDACRSGRVSGETISHLRKFLHRLEDHPNLLFIPPPPSG
jgi:tetratricopeptide (TPR) repeat protein